MYNLANISEKGVDFSSSMISDQVVYTILAGAIPAMILAYYLNPKDVKSYKKTGHSLDEKTTRFEDIGGCHEAKEALREIINALKNKNYYDGLGLKCPKAMLMYGPSGTGKTMLARAFAAEAGVEFLYVSGSEFVELYVGVGSARVRDLFEKAREQRPCIIFIDEIDAIGFRRVSGANGTCGGTREFDNTLNQILAEMDGLNDNIGIVVIAATNQELVLDPALIRPGRFDRKLKVGKPNQEERYEILSILLRKKTHMLAGSNISQLAKSTQGYTGAELSHVINDAGVLALKNGSKAIAYNDIVAVLKKYHESRTHFEERIPRD